MEPTEWVDDSHLLFFYYTTLNSSQSDKTPQPFLYSCKIH